MKNESGLSRVLLISGLFALPLMSLLFDIVLQGLQIRNSEGAGLEGVLVPLFPIFALVVVLVGLGLGRFLADGGRGISIVYAIVGLVLLFATPLIYFLPVPEGFYALIPYVQPGTSLFLAGAMLAGIGIIHLRKSNRKRRKG